MRLKYYYLLLVIQLIIILIAVFTKSTVVNNITITNSYQFTDPTNLDSPVNSVISSSAKEKLGCPIFVLPEPKPEPELELKDLERINPNNGKALDRIIMKHISDLTNYIREYEKQVKESYKNYVAKCDK